MNPLKVLIAEDEPGAAMSLSLALKEAMPEVIILAILPSNEEIAGWLSENEPPDLAFFDIHLQDGSSLDTLKKAPFLFPVIFTTAYDEYAIEAFKINSIDYLLKPVKESDLKYSLSKYQHLHGGANVSFSPSKPSASPGNEPGIGTFLVHQKDKLIPLPISEIAIFTIHKMMVYARTFDDQVYPVNRTLDEIESVIPSLQFFRASRQHIINRQSIKDLEQYFNGRLLINTIPQSGDPIIISKARVPIFKDWITLRN